MLDKKKWLWPILLAMISFGCGTPQPLVLSPEKPPRPKPVEAMVDCDSLPLLPEDLPSMKTEDALKEVIRNKLRGDEAYWACALKHNELIRWINDE